MIRAVAGISMFRAAWARAALFEHSGGRFRAARCSKQRAAWVRAAWFERLKLPHAANSGISRAACPTQRGRAARTAQAASSEAEQLSPRASKEQPFRAICGSAAVWQGKAGSKSETSAGAVFSSSQAERSPVGPKPRRPPAEI